MLEKEIEKKVKAYARSKNWLVYKFTSPGHRSVPDDIFMKDGRMFFIEFKKAGKFLTPKQTKERLKIMDAGFKVFKIDYVGGGMDLIDNINKGRIL